MVKRVQYNPCANDYFRRGGIGVPTQIFTVGKLVAVNVVPVPLQGKITFVDIADEENAELLYRYCFKSSNFRKFAQQLVLGTMVVAEGEMEHPQVLQSRNGAPSTLLIVGKVLRILQEPDSGSPKLADK